MNPAEGGKPSLRSLLTFMSQNEQVKTLLFAYLFQVNDWFGIDE